MLAFLCLYCLTFPPFLNDWFSHSLCFHIPLVVICFLDLSYSHCLFLPVVSRAISVVNESFCYFFFNPNIFLSISLQPHHSSQMHNAWRKYRGYISMYHLGCPQSNSTQTDVIYQLFSEEALLWKNRGEKGRKDKEQRNHQGGFWKAAGSKSHPVCCNANTQKHKVGHC